MREDLTSKGREFSGAPFDRDYGLADLLPLPVLAGLCAEFQRLAPWLRLEVWRPDGTLFYAAQEPEAHGPQPEGGEVCLALRHEMETLGYLRLRPEGEARTPLNAAALGPFLAAVLEQLILYRYKCLLTAALHGEVAGESFQRLKQKAAELELSEQKYRLLAEGLEKRVIEKTQEIKSAQTQLMQHEKLAAIGQLAAGMAHEINNPIGFVKSNLRSINGYIADLVSLLAECRAIKQAIMERAGRGPGWMAEVEARLKDLAELYNRQGVDYILEDLPQIVTESAEGIARIEKVVSNLRAFACIDRPEISEADLNACLRSTIEAMPEQIRAQASIVTRFQELPLVTCYPASLNQAFMNILVNAAQAVEGRGTITVTTALLSHEDRFRHLPAASDLKRQDFVRVTISDTGRGIAAEHLNHLFEPFFTTREVGQGMGLGLSTAYEIIKRHGGEVRVESELGRGATFIMEIPVCPDELTSHAAKAL